jgi:hypothetical protein
MLCFSRTPSLRCCKHGCMRAGLPPHTLLTCPIIDTASSRPIGILQCLNKRIVGNPFADSDALAAQLLATQAATAILNATQYDAEYRREVASRRVLELCEVLLQERDLATLPRLITARAKDLLASPRARLFFWDASSQSLSPVPIAVREAALNCAAVLLAILLETDGRNLPFMCVELHKHRSPQLPKNLSIHVLGSLRCASPSLMDLSNPKPM